MRSLAFGTMTPRNLFREFLGICCEAPSPRCCVPVFAKLKDEEVKKFNEAAALTSGAILETTVQKGEGEKSPEEGSLVYFHFTLYRLDEEESVVFSTRPENGTTEGCPFAAVLMKSPRLPRAWEMALLEMRKGERRILKVQPDFGFGYKDCEFHLPDDMRAEEEREMTMDLQLLNWYGSEDVMSVMGSSSDFILKSILRDGEGYENPRPPYKVQALVTLRKLPLDGVRQKGEVLFTTNDQPIELVMGDENVPSEIQSCLSSMVQNEHSICIFSAAKDEQPLSSVFPPLPRNLLQLEAEIQILHVIQVRDIYGDGRIMKYRLADGRGTFPSDCPLQDCRVTVHYKARNRTSDGGKGMNCPSSASEWNYDSRIANSGESLNVDLGCGNLPIGLEACIHLMLPGEVSRVECTSDCAYDNANTRCSVPAGMSASEDAEFEVELVQFQKGMQWAGISAKESLEEAQKMKNLANKLYKEGAIELAANKYRTIVQQLSAMHDFEADEQVHEADGLTMTCFSNLASCSIQDGEYMAAVDWCNKALKLDDENVKVLLRRAKAYSLHGDFEEAEEDLRQVQKLDSSLESEVEATLLKNKQRKKAALSKQKQQFHNFFDRKL